MSTTVVSTVIVRRRIPKYELLIASSSEPEILRPVVDRLEASPRLWSLRPRVRVQVAPSAGGSNVHIRLKWPPALLLEVLLLLFAVPALWSHSFLASGLILLAGAMTAWMANEMQSTAQSVLQTFEVDDESRSGPASRFSAASAAVLLLAAILAAAAFYRVQRWNRDEQLIRIDFPAGYPGTAVRAALGRPDSVLRGQEMQEVSADPRCYARARTELAYLGSTPDSYCAVYLDPDDHVVCVQHAAVSNPLH